jgi:hypothetical protein
MDWYVEHLGQDRRALWPGVRYLAHDGYYQKLKFVDAVVGLGLHGIGKLRCDANLQHLFHGIQQPRGRKKKFDGKVHFNNPARFELDAIQDNQRIYTAVVNSVSLKRNIRIAYIVSSNRKAKRYLRRCCFLPTSTCRLPKSITITKRDFKSNSYFVTRNSLRGF